MADPDETVEPEVEVDEAAEAPVADVDEVRVAAPGWVTSAAYPNIPRPATAANATPAVARFMSFMAESLAEALARIASCCVMPPMVRTRPEPSLGERWEIAVSHGAKRPREF